MACRGWRWLAGALALLGAMACGAGVGASTIYTYSFSQDYSYALGGGVINPATLTGGFTGMADTTGNINLGTLSDFHITFTLKPQGLPAQLSGEHFGLPDFFSFQVGDTSGSTLAFLSPVSGAVPVGDRPICVGAAVLLCGGGPRGVLFSSPGNVFASSEVAPVLTLVSTSSSLPVATTPIPGALLLFSTALGGMGVTRVFRARIAA